MKIQNKLSPSILAADFWQLGEQIQKVKMAGSQYLHFDVMDGVFVPSISFGIPVLESVRKHYEGVLDVHLMITEPERYINAFSEAGADIITIHLEATAHPREVLEKIHQCGKKAGLSVCPETRIEQVYPYLDIADMVLIMTVSPGFGGQKYREECTDKIKALRRYLKENHLDTDIEVDGGITRENVDQVISYGANVIVTGSAVFEGDCYENACFFIKELHDSEQ